MLFVLSAAGKEKRRSLKNIGKITTSARSIGSRDSRRTSSGLKRTSRLPRGCSQCRRTSLRPAALLKAFLRFPAKPDLDVPPRAI